MAAAAEALRSTTEFDYQTRRYNDTVTWLAEVLPGSMRAPFEYRFDGRELYASDGSGLEKIFDDSVEQAKNLPAYEQRRRRLEKSEYQDMLDMMRGDLPNTMVVLSDFPPELMDAKQDVGGYNVARKQTMLRILSKTPEGMLKMYSQSLDGSNRQALEAIYKSLGFEPEVGELLGQRMNLELGAHEQEFLVDQLTGVYDRNLSAQFGGDWYAGQRNGQRTNTFDFVCRQDDLLGAYLATTSRFTGGVNDYNLAAAVRARFLHKDSGRPAFVAYMPRQENIPIAAYAMAMAEMNRAGVVARREGVVVSGCGATIKLEADKLENSMLPGTDKLTAREQLDEAGYGNKNESESAGSDKFGPLKFKCPKGHWNERKPAKSSKDFLTNCKKCNTSLKC